MNSGQIANSLSSCMRFGLIVFAGAVCFPANRSLAAPPSEQVLKAPAFEVRVVRDVTYRDLCPAEDAHRNKNKLDLYKGGSHAWPDGGDGVPSAQRQIWRFFQATSPSASPS